MRAYAGRYWFPDSEAAIAAHHVELLGKSKLELKAYLWKHFDMYCLVHKLNEVTDLRYIYHPTSSNSMAIWKQNGAQVSWSTAT